VYGRIKQDWNVQGSCRWFGGVLIVLLLVVFALHKGTEIQTGIWIERSPTEVWQILRATDEYPSWNRFIRHLPGDLHPGSRIEVEIAPPDSSPMTLRPIVITVQRDREIRWLGSAWIRGIFDGEHSFRPESDGRRTPPIHAEWCWGILVGRLSDGILRKAHRSFVALNEAVKECAESRESGADGALDFRQQKI
jgi:hypothetical protein